MRTEPQRILLIDDHAPYAEVLKQMLRQHQVELDHVQSVHFAQRSVQQQHYTMLIVDENIGGDTGSGFVAWMSARSASPLTPVIVAHTLQEEAQVQKAYAALGVAFTAYIAKPVRATVLTQRIIHILQQ